MANPDKSNSSTCAHCGKAQRELKSGTITGWIFDSSTCRCDASELRREKQATTAPIICLNCNMPVAHRRKASITQWIFPAGKCSCERPKTEVEPSTYIKRNAGTYNAADDSASLQSAGTSATSTQIDSSSSTPSSSTDPELQEIASLLPERFTLSKFLGRGGVSVVCSAKDKYLRRLVAVKVFDKSVMESAELMRFQSEAKVIGRLTHPNIVQVFDFGINEIGKPFMVLEYVSGTTLRQLIKSKGPLSNEEALVIFAGVASALAYAHENGFSHRDLKPENLIIQTDSKFGTVAKIIDFGLAKYVNANDAFTTHSGITLNGTPPYMPPDQANGKTFDERSEIYSYGCVLFESLTGSTPFAASTALEMIAKHSNEMPPFVVDLNPDADVELSDLVQKCLNKNPDDRPQSFREILNHLESMSSDSSKLIVSNVQEPQNRSKSSKLVIGISALAAVLLLLLLPSVLQHENTTKDHSLENSSDQKNSSAPGKRSIESIGGDHFETFSLNGMDSELKDLDLVSKRPGQYHLTPKADDVMMRVVSKASNIKKADFSNSDITDKVLLGIGGLDKITELTLDNCKITDAGIAALSRSVKLKMLSIADIAQLSRKGLKALRSLPLTEINLGGNHLLDEDLKELSNLKAQTFRLCDIGLDDRSANFFESKTAEYVDVRKNKIGIDGLSTLLKLPSIKTIAVSPTTNLTLDKVNSLKASLNSSCEVLLTDVVPKTSVKKNYAVARSHLVTSFSPVRYDEPNNTIELIGSLTKDDYKRVLSYPNARRLNAYYVMEMDPEGFKIVTQLPLQIVSLTGSGADDKIVALLAGMPSLRNLFLSKTDITDAGLAPLAALKNLEELVIDSCNITDGGLVALSNYQALERLSIKNITQVSERGIRSLTQLPLTNINFNGNELNIHDIEAASQLKATYFDFRKTGLDDQKISRFKSTRAISLRLIENKIGPDGLSAVMKLPALAEVWLSPYPGLTPTKIAAIKKACNKQKCIVTIVPNEVVLPDNYGPRQVLIRSNQ